MASIPRLNAMSNAIAITCFKAAHVCIYQGSAYAQTVLARFENLSTYFIIIGVSPIAFEYFPNLVGLALVMLATLLFVKLTVARELPRHKTVKVFP